MDCPCQANPVSALLWFVNLTCTCSYLVVTHSMRGVLIGVTSQRGTDRYNALNERIHPRLKVWMARPRSRGCLKTPKGSTLLQASRCCGTYELQEHFVVQLKEGKRAAIGHTCTELLPKCNAFTQPYTIASDRYLNTSHISSDEHSIGTNWMRPAVCAMSLPLAPTLQAVPSIVAKHGPGCRCGPAHRATTAQASAPAPLQPRGRAHHESAQGR
jgi:hypothetical protein